MQIEMTPVDDSVDKTANNTSTPTMIDTVTDSYDAMMRGELTDASSALLMKVVLPGAMGLTMLIVAYFVAKLLSRWASTMLSSKVDTTLGKFGGRLVYYSIMLVSGLAILQTLGVNATSFAAVLAAAGFAIGLAFQGTLSNFASGILLLVFRPFKVGDVVNAAGLTGCVNAIDLFTTTFDTPDNRRLIIPNSAISSGTIENISFHPERRVEVVVGVAYSASLDETRDVLVQCAESMSEYLITGEGRGYQIVLGELGASSVDWKVRFWTQREDFFTVQEKLTEKIKHGLDERAIDIPFPQMELHIASGSNPEESANALEGLAHSDGSSAVGTTKRVRPRSRRAS